MSQEELQLENERLRAAIVKHRSQKADDRCIEDDDELYAVLGDGIKCDRRVGDKIAMLNNCARFIENRCEGGHWPSYVQLEEIATTAASLCAARHHKQAITEGLVACLLISRLKDAGYLKVN